MTLGQCHSCTTMETAFILPCLSLRALRRKEGQVYIVIKPIFTFSHFAIHLLTDFTADNSLCHLFFTVFSQHSGVSSWYKGTSD